MSKSFHRLRGPAESRPSERPDDTADGPRPSILREARHETSARGRAVHRPPASARKEASSIDDPRRRQPASQQPGPRRRLGCDLGRKRLDQAPSPARPPGPDTSRPRPAARAAARSATPIACSRSASVLERPPRRPELVLGIDQASIPAGRRPASSLRSRTRRCLAPVRGRSRTLGLASGTARIPERAPGPAPSAAIAAPLGRLRPIAEGSLRREPSDRSPESRPGPPPSGRAGHNPRASPPRKAGRSPSEATPRSSRGSLQAAACRRRGRSDYRPGRATRTSAPSPRARSATAGPCSRAGRTPKTCRPGITWGGVAR